MAASSVYETNFLKQPSEWKKLLLDIELTENLYYIIKEKKKIFFVGTGSSYCICGISEFLWKKYLGDEKGVDVTSVSSFDFVRSRFQISSNDIVVVFSHRARPNTFSIKALDTSKRKYRATTILVTGIGSPDYSTITDFRIETCALEKTEAFTVSVTSAIVRVIQLLGMFNKSLLRLFEDSIGSFERLLPLQILKPKFYTNLIIIGDLIREDVAYETALKIAETSYLPVRRFGLEEFLHGPMLTIDKQTSVLVFSTKSEPRYDVLIRYVKTIGSEIIVIDEGYFFHKNIPKELSWLSQLIYGQQLALELSKVCKTNPDSNRQDQSPYLEAANILK